jgi:tRNA-dihydrouridine synthase B
MTSSSTSNTLYNTPLLIDSGKVSINSRVVLAPMAGVTDIVFRGLVRRFAPDSLICTEMISSNGLVYSKRWDAPILDKALEDHPIAYQLAAHREEVLLEAGLTIEKHHKPDTLDLNMGCPVKKITGNFEGCSLMRDVDLAHQLVKALAQTVSVPVTVKCRLGWDDNSMNYVEFAQALQEAGAKMITLHARTRAQGYKPHARWECFGELKQALNIPVIANGDITTAEEAYTIMNTYGVDGVMIGRGCQGEPWKVGQIDHYLKTGEHLPELTLGDRLALAYEHAEQMATYRGEVVGVKEMRGQLPWYVKGFRGASEVRQKLTAVSTLEDVKREFIDLLKEHDQKEVKALSDKLYAQAC